MSQRGIDFLENWKLKYVDSLRRNVTPEEIDKWTARCLNAARLVGISEKEIQEELAEDDLRSHLADALEN